MNIKKIKLIYFSPTGTTKKTLEGIAQGLQSSDVDYLDLTLPSAASCNFEQLQSNELAIIGVPVYSGRMPSTAVERLKRLKADKTPAVVVVVYGNRAYDDTLLELKDLVSEIGFIPIAGGAFIGEHSFSNDITPIAAGRPDTKDLAKAKTFGEDISKTLLQLNQSEQTPILEVPGNFPYKPLKGLSESPITNEETCTHCKLCMTVCPTAAIEFNGSILTNQETCIKCCACVKICPTNARVIPSQIKPIAERLSKNFSERREPEFY
jgi:ferredoxin